MKVHGLAPVTYFPVSVEFISSCLLCSNHSWHPNMAWVERVVTGRLGGKYNSKWLWRYMVWHLWHTFRCQLSLLQLTFHPLIMVDTHPEPDQNSSHRYYSSLHWIRCQPSGLNIPKLVQHSCGPVNISMGSEYVPLYVFILLQPKKQETGENPNKISSKTESYSSSCYKTN